MLLCWVWLKAIESMANPYRPDEPSGLDPGGEMRHPADIQHMFERIARRYDWMNRLMTFGQDLRWRREVITHAQLGDGGRLLDLGAGTGDLSYEAIRQQPGCQVIAADFTLRMMQVGRRRPHSGSIAWVTADALNLPFPDQVFDAVVSGFLLRNVADLPRTLREQYRVLKPGGQIVALDTTRPDPGWLAPMINFHLHSLIPLLGQLFAGSRQAYTYLPASTDSFLSAQALAEQFRRAGFSEVGFRRRMFGTIAIHWGIKQ